MLFVRIFILCNNLEINHLKIIQGDLDYFLHSVSDSVSVLRMKIMDLSHLFKYDKSHNWWVSKYFFVVARYLFMILLMYLFYISLYLVSWFWRSKNHPIQCNSFMLHEVTYPLFILQHDFYNHFVICSAHKTHLTICEFASIKHRLKPMKSKYIFEIFFT